MSRTPQVLAALVAAFALAFLATAGVPAAAATTSQAKAKPAASKATAGKRARTMSPTRTESELPSVKNGRLAASIFKTAKSEGASEPTTFASKVLPSCMRTVIFSAASMT